MRKFILDTNILLAYVRQSPPFLNKIHLNIYKIVS
jgi:hypothetical protein